MAVGQKDANPWGAQVRFGCFGLFFQGFVGYPVLLTHSQIGAPVISRVF